ncbi:hypothetical protein OPQ81_008611 [Rhizoctonia solani]|nr:hypothetical protein OPQ81_008611 [Rhizoctonia solani]
MWVSKTLEPEIPLEALSELTRLEDVLRDIKETMNQSKNILENVNRVLIATQRTQSTVGSFDTSIKSTVHMNPVNQQGVLASEFGLPLLRYWLRGADYVLWMDPQSIADYLEFFNIGTDLIRGSNKPTLVDGRGNEAAKLLFKHIGIHYSNAQYYYAEAS